MIDLAMLLLVAYVGLACWQGHRMLASPIATRSVPHRTPADVGLAHREVELRSADGTRLVGWYVPSRNGAAVVLQHGFKSQREEMLEEACMLAGAGFGVLVTSVRGHDACGGDRVSFDRGAVDDLRAFVDWLSSCKDVDAERIGILGNSYGGMLALRLASEEPRLRTVVSNCAFASLEDTVDQAVRRLTGLPPWLFAPAIAKAAEAFGGFRVAEVDTRSYLAGLGQRPVFLLQAGRDEVVSPANGEALRAVAKGPCELWIEPELGHARFDRDLPVEYERRVVSWFERHLGVGA